MNVVTNANEGNETTISLQLPSGAEHKIGQGLLPRVRESMSLFILNQLHDKRFHLSLGKTMNKTQTFYTLIKLYPVR